MESYRLVGVVGTALFSIFTFFVLRRSIIVWRALRDIDQPKVVFHVSILLFAVAEVIYSLNLIGYQKYSLWGYAFHICGIFFFTLAYATVLHIWGQTIGRHHKYTHRAGALVISLNLISTVIAVGFLFSSKDFKHFYHHFQIINILLILTFCLTNIFFTLGMLRYGLRLQERVKRSPITSLADQQRCEQIIRRINVVLLVCASCFSLRLIALGTLSYSLLNDSDPLPGIGLLGWFLLSSWIPFLVPGLTLLVIMRVPSTQPAVNAPPLAIQSPLLTQEPPMPSLARDLESGSSPTPSRFNSSLGRLSSPILPLPMNLMNLEGLEGLFVESRGSGSSAVSLSHYATAK